jgi:hypothetical protein
MSVRHWIGDIGLAVLLALPTVALSRPQPAQPEQTASSPFAEEAANSDASATERRFSLED